MATLGTDLLYACRLWRRAPVFAVVVVCTIALAVGAATAVFSVIHGLLGPLPFPEPERLVSLHSRFGGGGGAMEVTPRDFVHWRSRARSFSRLAARRMVALSFAVPGSDPERAIGWGATAGYFDLLGCPPLAGRLLREADYAPGAPPVAVLSQSLWRSRLGGDPHAMGRTVLLDGQAVTVVGILNDRVEEGLGDVWRPMVADPEGRQHDNSILVVLGRLLPGVSVAQARREMERVVGETPDRSRPQRVPGVVVVSLRDDLLGTIHRGRLAALLTAAGCLFLAACANLVSLSFAWISWRRREIAIRVALGAAPGRIVRQLLTEVLVLASTGGLLGVVFAVAGLRVILGLNPGAVPRIAGALVNGTCLLFALAVSLLAGVAVGIWPALDATRPALRALLGAEDGGREHAPVRWLGGALIAVEVAAAFVLLSCAGLSLRGFLRLAAVDPGFRTERRLTARIAVPEPRYGERGQGIFYMTLAERLRVRSGIDAAGVLFPLPTGLDGMALEFFVPGKAPGPPVRQVSIFRIVTPGTLETLGIPLVAGRDFAAADGADAPWVAVVNESLARRVWPGVPAVGRIFGLPQSNGTLGRTTIVGVAADLRNRLDEEPVPEMYLPFSQWGVPEASVVVRTTLKAKEVDRILRATVHAFDPSVPVDPCKPFDSVVAESLSPFRFGAVLLALYAALALILAAVGVYGVISYSVARRRREIALRVALGARRGAILWMVCRQTFLPTCAGLAAGFAAALAAGRFLAGQLFGVSAGDPAVFLTVLAVLLGVGLCATAEPALRASATDPADAMR